MHLRIPFVETVHLVDVRWQPFETKVFCASKDRQPLSIHVALLSRPRVESLPALYAQYGLDSYTAQLLPSVCHDVVKDLASQHGAADLIPSPQPEKDHILDTEMREVLKGWLKEFGVETTSTSVTHIAFPNSLYTAIGQQPVQKQADKAGQATAASSFNVEENDKRWHARKLQIVALQNSLSEKPSKS
jgi:prohibitin 1